MRNHQSLVPLTLLSALALTACGNPVSLGRDDGVGGGSGTVSANASGSGNTSTGSSTSTSTSSAGGSTSSGAGGGGSMVFAPSHTPDYLVIDDANVYWADKGSIFGMPKSGGKSWAVASAAPIPGPPSVLDLEVDSTGVYYTEGINASPSSSAIRKAPILGGATSVVAQAGTIACFTLVGDSVYHVEQFVSNTPGGAIYKTPTAGGATTTVIIEPAKTAADPEHQEVTPLGLVADATSVYWMNAGPDGSPSDTWGVASATLLGAGLTRIGDTTPHQAGLCKHVVIDDVDVYWVREAPSPGVVRAPKGGGAETVLAGDVALNLVIDAMYVYYVTGDSVRRVAKAGGAPETLADGQLHPFGIAVDDTHVYWTNLGTFNGGQYAGDGAVMRIAKP